MPIYRTDKKYITHLVQNYRSHEAILRISSKLFYGNSLQAKGNAERINRYIGTSILMSRNFPVIFDAQRGVCSRQNEETSFFNQLEVDTVISYIQKLLQSPELPKITQKDIGIVTTYKKQMKLLMNTCKRNSYCDIEIGSVELFQGKEKPVIIVSTVRSQMNSIGFLKSPKVGVLVSLFLGFKLPSFFPEIECSNDESDESSDHHW